MIGAYATANKLVLGQLKTDKRVTKSRRSRAIATAGSARSTRFNRCHGLPNQDCQDHHWAEGWLPTGSKRQSGQFVQSGPAGLQRLTQRCLLAGGITDWKTAWSYRVSPVSGPWCEHTGRQFSRWKGLKTLAMITSFRTEKGKPVSMEYRYYISSRIMSAEQVASAVREPWAIESMPHWVLDVSMQKMPVDIQRSRSGIFGLFVRHLAEWTCSERNQPISIVQTEAMLMKTELWRRCWLPDYPYRSKLTLLRSPCSSTIL